MSSPDLLPIQMRDFDVLALGEPMVEFNEQPDGRFLMGCGGDTSNAAVAAARLGARAAYMNAVGADAFGDVLLAMWAREGVDARHVRRVEGGATGIYFVTHGSQGHAFTYRRAGSAASLIAPADIASGTIAATRVLHVSGISQAISNSAADAVFAAVEAARAAGTAVSYDPNFRAALWPLPRARAVIEATAALADILLPGLEDARALTGLDDPGRIADHYLKRGAKVVALTLGAEGAFVATPTERLAIPPHSVPLVDATGAGDTFDGAFLAELARGADPFAAARFANAAAALAVQGYGAIEPMPRRGQVEALLASDAVGAA